MTGEARGVEGKKEEGPQGSGKREKARRGQRAQGGGDWVQSVGAPLGPALGNTLGSVVGSPWPGKPWVATGLAALPRGLGGYWGATGFCSGHLPGPSGGRILGSAWGKCPHLLWVDFWEQFSFQGQEGGAGRDRKIETREKGKR